MGIILNVRGTSGSGKTEFARRILVSHSQLGYEPEPVVRIGRTKPIAYVLRAKGAAALPPLLVIGHYERGSGGCDTILKADGGMDRVFTLASYYAERNSMCFSRETNSVANAADLWSWRGAIAFMYCG